MGLGGEHSCHGWHLYGIVLEATLCLFHCVTCSRLYRVLRSGCTDIVIVCTQAALRLKLPTVHPHVAITWTSDDSLSDGWLQAFVLFMVLLHLIEAGASGLAVTGTGISVLIGTALVLTIIETSVSQLVLSFIAGPTQFMQQQPH